MGTGSSKIGSSGKPKKTTVKNFPEGFSNSKLTPGAYYSLPNRERNKIRKDWDSYVDSFGTPLKKKEADLIDGHDFVNGTPRRGYTRSENSYKINKALNDPQNVGKADSAIFDRKDLATVNALDNAIKTHTTPSDAHYTRFCSVGSLKNSCGLTDAQIGMINQVLNNPTDKNIGQLSKALSGSRLTSRGYTSTSANRNLNEFSKTPALKVERQIHAPKGTNAYASKINFRESEVVFGRNLKTNVTGVSVSSDGHLVIHESYVGY